MVAGEAGGITQHIGAYQVEQGRPPDHLHRHPGPRGVHRHAGPRRRGHRHRHPGGGGRRRRHAPDRRGHQPRQGGRGADRRRHQQDRPRERRPQPGHAAALRAGPRARGVGRRHDHGRGLRAAEPRLDDLLEQLLLVADRRGARRPTPRAAARGVVLEANLDVGRGPVATVLVERGTLRVGDPIVAGAAWGRVRALIDDKGDNVKEALPVDAGAGARPVRRARRGRRVPGRPRRQDRPDRRRGPRASATASPAWRGTAAATGTAAPSSRTSSSRSSGARRPRST